MINERNYNMKNSINFIKVAGPAGVNDFHKQAG